MFDNKCKIKRLKVFPNDVVRFLSRDGYPTTWRLIMSVQQALGSRLPLRTVPHLLLLSFIYHEMRKIFFQYLNMKVH
jgi:hypothetical protein